MLAMQVIFYAYTYGQTLCRSILIVKYFCSCGTCTINSSRWLFIGQNLFESYIWNILLTIFGLSLILSIKNNQIHISIRNFLGKKSICYLVNWKCLRCIFNIRQYHTVWICWLCWLIIHENGTHTSIRSPNGTIEPLAAYIENLYFYVSLTSMMGGH